MEKKDVFVELDRIKKIVKRKVERKKGFHAFAISYSISNGNHYLQLDQWQTQQERTLSMRNTINWIKGRESYAFIFGAMTTKHKFASKSDYEKNVEHIIVPGSILIAKTPDKTQYLMTEYKVENEQYVFVSEKYVDKINDNNLTILDEVYRGTN